MHIQLDNTTDRSAGVTHMAKCQCGSVLWRIGLKLSTGYDLQSGRHPHQDIKVIECGNCGEQRSIPALLSTHPIE